MEFSGLEKLSLVDFDDNLTATLFMAGCPFRCPFCHNADLVLHPNLAPKIPFEEILDYLKKRKGVLDAVCITGGEPTLMPDLEEKIRAIRALGYAVKLDSNGYNPDILRDLIDKGLLDYVAMDIKNSKLRYSETAGIPIDIHRIEESVELLKTCGIRYEFRTTIMEEFHDYGDIQKIGEWIQGAPRYYLQKYTDGEHCIQHYFHEISPQKALEFKEIIKAYVGNVGFRGYEF